MIFQDLFNTFHVIFQDHNFIFQGPLSIFFPKPFSHDENLSKHAQFSRTLCHFQGLFTPFFKFQDFSRTHFHNFQIPGLFQDSRTSGEPCAHTQATISTSPNFSRWAKDMWNIPHVTMNRAYRTLNTSSSISYSQKSREKLIESIEIAYI